MQRNAEICLIPSIILLKEEEEYWSGRDLLFLGVRKGFG